MGLEPFLVASSVRAFIAQRLVRKLCSNCRIESRPPDLNWLRGAGFDITTQPTALTFRASPEGCESCRYTGFKGRLAIYELCRITEQLTELIVQGAPSSQLHQQARLEGFRTMKEYGWEKVLEGETTIEEVLSATG